MTSTKPAFVLVFMLLIFSLCTACSDSADEGVDGDTDIIDGDTETIDGDTEAEAEKEVCTYDTPFCDGEDVMKCADGVETRESCQSGTYCNYGECQTSTVTFPEDAGIHAENTEWWYYTGHVTDGITEWGFEVTVFQYDLEKSFEMEGYGYMCHVGITDKTAGEHYHTDTFHTSTKTWTNDPIELDLWNCHFYIGGDGKDHVIGVIPEGKEKDGKASPWQVDLRFDPEKRATLHGGDGIIPMSTAGGTSWYYSFTRLAAEGSVSTPDGEFDVTGQAWMDHQWGDFDITDFKGWDWWSMQFADGYELMLFQFTDWNGNLASQAGSITDPHGNVTELEGMEAFSITPKRAWESPHTDGTYPLDWDIEVAAMNWSITVTTSVDDQEMYNMAQNYWEGETSITGTRNGEAVNGVGYTELTGYATDLLDPVFDE